MVLSRRTLLTTAAASLAAPAISLGEERRTIRFLPHADLASLDPVWTTADITRNFSLAVYDTLYGFDTNLRPEPQMAAGHAVEDGGRRWRISLREGLRFHDGSTVLARDCVATIKRFSQRDPFGAALAERLDEISAPSDTVIELRLKSPFALVPDALAQYTCAIMPERLAKTDPNTQITEVMGSGPFRFVAAERVPGSRVVYEKNPDYVPRSDGTPSFTAGPKIVHIDRVVWTFVPDAATSLAAMSNNEYDWWEAPSLDLVPSLQKQRDLSVRVLDHSGEIGCLRFNALHPPFNNQKIRRAILEAVNQSDYIQAIAGGAPEFMRAGVGLFVPGSPMASTVGLEITKGQKSVDETKAALHAAGYQGEKVVILAPTTIPSIWGAAQVTQDLLSRVGMNIDFQALEWGSVVQRRASREPVEKGGWSIFHTNLGGMGNVSPAANIAIRGSGASAWFGWPDDAKMEALRTAWFDAPDLATQQRLAAEMQARFWENPSFVPLGMFDQPSAYFSYLQDVREGWPQFYGVRRA